MCSESLMPVSANPILAILHLSSDAEAVVVQVDLRVFMGNCNEPFVFCAACAV